MKSPLIARIVYFLFFSLFIVAAGFFGSVITALSGGLKFYTPLIVVIAVFLVVLLFLIFSHPFHQNFSKSQRFHFSALSRFQSSLFGVIPPILIA